MKKISLFISCLLCVGSISCQKNTDTGLVAYYSFNGDASDQSANGNHGVVNGAILTSDRFGNANSAYSLDGTSAYILALVKNMPAADSPQTISLWFKIDQPPEYIDSLGADNIIALVDSAEGIGVQIGYRAPGYNTHGLDTWYWGGRSILESEQPVINEWHHCVYTYDGQTHIFYLDGQKKAQSSVEPQRGIANMLMLGNYPGGDQFFHGSLDEILIYNRNLSLSEIELLYNEKE